MGRHMATPPRRYYPASQPDGNLWQHTLQLMAEALLQLQLIEHVSVRCIVAASGGMSMQHPEALRPPYLRG